MIDEQKISNRYEHRLTNRNRKTMTGDCPTHGPDSPMDVKGRCALRVKERIQLRAAPRRYKSEAGDFLVQMSEIERMKDEIGCCEVCGKDDVKLFLDHCHKTGNIRGILCPRCNTGLGYFNDDVDLMRSAIRYLLKGN